MPDNLSEFMTLLEDLQPYEDDMTGGDFDFYRDMGIKVRRYGEKTIVSDAQMSWLRDIRKNFIDDDD